MNTLSAQRCAYHPVREAVARCTRCHLYCCRECATEHSGQILCGVCLRSFKASRPAARRLLVLVLRKLQPMGGLILLVVMFYLLGRLVLAITEATLS